MSQEFVNSSPTATNLPEQFRSPTWGAEKLRTVALFQKFNDQELELLYSLGELRTYRPRTYAVIEGEPTRGLYILLKGRVSVYKNDSTSGSMYRIAVLESDSHFGELSLFDQAPRTATVASDSTCHMFYLDAEQFDGFLQRCGGEAQVRFFKTCAEELVSRFRNLNEDYIHAQRLLWQHALSGSDEKPSTSTPHPPPE